MKLLIVFGVMVAMVSATPVDVLSDQIFVSPPNLMEAEPSMSTLDAHNDMEVAGKAGEILKGAAEREGRVHIPLDTPEVAYAKAQHLAYKAHREWMDRAHQYAGNYMSSYWPHAVWGNPAYRFY